ncbi:MAG: GMP/IMP nucleotidase [Gammaproteobacteria bacterium]|nr:GMP/IMP nucleotidase [Gammaproteobacteria bacterium]
MTDRNTETAASLDTVRALEPFDTILLDMDGTLLDLAFDNYFWRELVPRVYAGRRNISHDQARDHIYELYAGREGTLDWYCLDFWTEQLQLDLEALKQVSSHRIRFLPGAREFLQMARRGGKRLVLVTNAHQLTLAIKKDVTGLHYWIDEFVSSHDIGVPKEDQAFWHALREQLDFAPEKTLFVDDSLPVLAAATEFGLGGVVAIRRPDTRQPPREIDGHAVVDGVHHWLGSVS